MKVFRPGLPAIFTDEDAPQQPNRAFTPAEKAAGADKPLLSPEAAMAAAAARHAVSTGADAEQPDPNQQAAPVPPAAPAATVPAPSPNPGASGAPATTQIIPPVAPQPLIDKNAPPAPSPAPTPQPEQPTADPLALTPAEEAELDALLAKRNHTPAHQEPPKS